MKRILLSIGIVAVCLSALGQGNYVTITGPGKDQAVIQPQMHPGDAGIYAGAPAIGQKTFDNTILGTNWYDLQSYTNLMQRMWVYDDGTIGATWHAAGEGLVPERGAGYNYFDGNAWGTMNPHVGPADRMGWPSYAPWGPQGEIICLYKYVAGSGPLKFYKREIKGQGDWIETQLDPPTGCSLVWQSMITSGENHEYIHLLAYTYDAVYNGQTNALLYYRSSDGAESWDVEELTIDGLGPDYFPTIHSLTYAWANPVGDILAFTYAFDELGGWVFKSYDNGDSWEFFQVMETPLDPFNIPTDMDDFPCGCGTSAIALDSQGNAHVVFGRMKKNYAAGTQYFYPFTDGLIYWNESMPVIDTGMISSYTLEYLEEAGMLCGWVMTEQTTITIPEGQPNYNSSMCSFPQISIDAEDNIFVAYMMLAPDYTNAEFMYRHVALNSSYDLGNSWVGLFDLNADIQYIFSECAYPAMPPVIDDEVFVLFQEDTYPGINQWLTNHDPVECRMMFMAIDKNTFVGVKEDNPVHEMEFSVYPNPVTDKIYMNVNLMAGSDLMIRISNSLGVTVLQENLGTNGQGSVRHVLDVSALPAGVYFCSLNAGFQKTVQKIVIR